MEEVVTPARQAVLEHLADLFGTLKDRPGGQAPCKRHSWMVEQQTNHRYCHICGKHGW